jgi:hypothetical protein
MVVLTNEGIAKDTHRRLSRKCLKCKDQKWPAEFETIYAKRCMECRDALALSKCQNCGGPTGADRNPRKYCMAPECQEAKALNRARLGGQRRSARIAGLKTKRCPACGKSKPRTLEHFTISERHVDGTVKRLMGLCRPCKRAYDAALYAINDDVREAARARNRGRYARAKERMQVDPEFAERMRAQGRERSRRYKERRRQQRDVGTFRATENAKDAGWSGNGPPMPAGPLMAALDEYKRVEGLTDDALAARIGTTPRRLYEWRLPGSTTRMSLVDAALVEMDMLWFDIYPEDEFPEVAAIWEG